LIASTLWLIDFNTPSKLLPLGCKIYGFKFESKLSGISIIEPAPAPASVSLVLTSDGWLDNLIICSISDSSL
jgi:hypothetical protein